MQLLHTALLSMSPSSLSRSQITRLDKFIVFPTIKDTWPMKFQKRGGRRKGVDDDHTTKRLSFLNLGGHLECQLHRDQVVGLPCNHATIYS